MFGIFFVNIIMGNIAGFIIKSISLKNKELGLNFSGLLSSIGCFLERNNYDYVKITFEKHKNFSHDVFIYVVFYLVFFYFISL